MIRACLRFSILCLAAALLAFASEMGWQARALANTRPTPEFTAQAFHALAMDTPISEAQEALGFWTYAGVLSDGLQRLGFTEPRRLTRPYVIYEITLNPVDRVQEKRREVVDDGLSNSVAHSYFFRP